jgi:hypothetical protein
MHAPVKDEPKWVPPGTDWPHRETDRPPPAAVVAPLRVCSRRFPTDLENCILAIDQGRLDRMVARHPLRTI